MAKKATGEVIAADMQPPNYRGAVQRIRTIKAKKDKVSGINGEIADVWAKVEGHKVHKGAGKDFLKLDNMEHEDRVRYMRDLNGLIDAAGWDAAEQDLVDQSEGKVVHMRFGGNAGSEDADDADDADESAAARSNDFLKQARQHLDGKAAPFTGDNTDLTQQDADLAGDSESEAAE